MEGEENEGQKAAIRIGAGFSRRNKSDAGIEACLPDCVRQPTNPCGLAALRTQLFYLIYSLAWAEQNGVTNHKGEYTSSCCSQEAGKQNNERLTMMMTTMITYAILSDF